MPKEIVYVGAPDHLEEWTSDAAVFLVCFVPNVGVRSVKDANARNDDPVASGSCTDTAQV